MSKSIYSILSKQDLIEILEKIPSKYVYRIVDDMCNDALNKQMDAQINSIKKCEELRKELKNKEHSISDIEKLDLIISETKSTTIFKRNVKQDTKN